MWVNAMVELINHTPNLIFRKKIAYGGFSKIQSHMFIHTDRGTHKTQFDRMTVILLYGTALKNQTNLYDQKTKLTIDYMTDKL